MSANVEPTRDLDPVGLRIAEALARRASAQQGEARQKLMERLEAFIDRWPSTTSHAEDAAQPHERDAHRAALSGLSELTARLARSAAAQVVPLSASNSSEAKRTAASTASPIAHGTAQVGAVGAFQHTWSRLRVEQRMRQAMAQVPAMAGPLNSSLVINRALHTMRELSPEYLDAFMLHVDALLWMEQSVALTAHAPQSTEGGRRPGPRAARKA